MKKITLKSKRDASVRRNHPWVFSGAVAKKSEDLQDGDLVEVYDHRDNYLATGHFQDGSIQVRLFSFEQTEAGTDFWKAKLREAWTYRQALGLPQDGFTDCFRLVHAEGDGMPGLIIDWYAGTAIIQCHSIGMHRQIGTIGQALQDLFGESLHAIYSKSARALPRNYGATVTDGYLYGDSDSYLTQENGLSFYVDWEEGQKTGFFLDQRTNRALLRTYALGKKVANTFSYTGGFSIYALAAGASHVDSVDISGRAMELTDKNVALNFGDDAKHTSHTQDVMEFLKECDADYDLMVVDPPAFAKTMKKRHQAVQGYKRLNALALRKVKSGGLLFTFSCSQVVDKTLFDNTIVAAAVEARRQVRIMHHLNQPADHPVNLFHPEGNYLKGLVLYVT